MVAFLFLAFKVKPKVNFRWLGYLRRLNLGSGMTHCSRSLLHFEDILLSKMDEDNLFGGHVTHLLKLVYLV